MIIDSITTFALICVIGLSVLVVAGLLLNALALGTLILRDLLEELFGRNP